MHNSTYILSAVTFMIMFWWMCVTGVQVELVNLLDLQLLSDGDSPEKSDEDDGSEWRTRDSEKSINAHPIISQLYICINYYCVFCCFIEPWLTG